MATFSNNLVANNGENGIDKYVCIHCDYKCCKKYNWDKHITTRKHIKATIGNNLATEKWQKWQIIQCENCGKEYSDRTGLWRHKKKCNQQQKETDEPTDKELIFKILKQNSELIKENSELRKEQTDIKELILKFKG